MNSLFFELLQVSIGNRECLSRNPSTCEWTTLFAIAKAQTMVGIAFNGLQRLPQKQTIALPKLLKMQWLGLVVQIQKRNELINKRCVELQCRLAEDGVRSCILKGQGVATLYGKELSLLRQSGDIDIYVDCNCKEALEYLNRKNVAYGHWDYLHVDSKLYDDVEVEMHYRPSVMRNILSNYRFQRYIDSNKEAFFSGCVNVGDSDDKLIVPVAWMNVFYLLHHTFRHLLTEGVGLRQVMDCYYALTTSNLSDNDREKLKDAVDKFGMRRFAKGLAWVIEEVFLADNVEDFRKQIPWKADVKEGKFILNEIMLSGNFGHSDNRYSKGKGRTEKLIKVFRRSIHLLTHYPSEALAAPFYYGWHFGWKRAELIKVRGGLSPDWGRNE